MLSNSYCFHVNFSSPKAATKRCRRCLGRSWVPRRSLFGPGFLGRVARCSYHEIPKIRNQHQFYFPDPNCCFSRACQRASWMFRCGLFSLWKVLLPKLSTTLFVHTWLEVGEDLRWGGLWRLRAVSCTYFHFHQKSPKTF